jgi:hypothetical protein
MNFLSYLALVTAALVVLAIPITLLLSPERFLGSMAETVLSLGILFAMAAVVGSMVLHVRDVSGKPPRRPWTACLKGRSYVFFDVAGGTNVALVLASTKGYFRPATCGGVPPEDMFDAADVVIRTLDVMPLDPSTEEDS